jgi:acid phosphatase family membrane protein YuiD
VLASLPGPIGAYLATALAVRYGADVVQAGIGVTLAVVVAVAAFVLRPGLQTHARAQPAPMA